LKYKKILQCWVVVTTVSLLTISSVQSLTVEAVSFPDKYVNNKEALKDATL